MWILYKRRHTKSGRVEEELRASGKKWRKNIELHRLKFTLYTHIAWKEMFEHEQKNMNRSTSNKHLRHHRQNIIQKSVEKNGTRAKCKRQHEKSW